MDTKPISIGDILKSESDFNSRVAIDAPADTAIGTLIEHPERDGEYLIALSNAEHGKVLVQPRNCTVCLNSIKSSAITADTTLADLKTQGDVYGIKYLGEPIISDSSDSSDSSEVSSAELSMPLGNE